MGLHESERPESECGTKDRLNKHNVRNRALANGDHYERLLPDLRTAWPGSPQELADDQIRTIVDIRASRHWRALSSVEQLAGAVLVARVHGKPVPAPVPAVP
jgi:hypothetical protein